MPESNYANMVRSAMMKLIACIVLLPLLVKASPRVNYPLNSQFPPVARVGSPFSFEFASTTFSSDSESESLEYSLTGNPSWLSLDERSRTLSGTPSANDVGFSTFTITAAGNGGAIANMDAKLYVSTDTGPEATGNISSALSAAGSLSGSSTVVLKPSASFSITFPGDTFATNGKKLSYFAMLSDHTPLPAWIRFDGPSLRFSGTTLSTSSAQAFDVELIVCDTPGFAASSVSFTMSVSMHTLAFEPFNQTINLTKGDSVHINGLEKKLLLDGSPIATKDLDHVEADVPTWLTFDNKTFEVSGDAPAGTMSQNISITARDRFGDTSELSISIVFKSELFAGGLDDLRLTPGKHFEYQVQQSILVKADESITFEFGPLAEYIHFDPSTFLIAGTVPEDFTPQRLECSITATASDDALKDTQTFYIDVSSPDGTGQPKPGSTTTNSYRETNGKRDSIIVGCVIGSTCGTVLLIALIACFRRRRKNSKGYLNPKRPRSPRKSDISRPTFIPYGWPDTDMAMEEDLEKGKEDHEPELERTPEHAPKIDVNFSADRRDSLSVTDSIGDASTRILDIFDESPYGIQNDTAPSQHPHDSMKIPTELAKRGSERSDTYRKHKRRTTTVYQDQIHRSTGLPVNRRITGMGHGRHTYSPSRSNTNFSSIRRPLSTSSYTTRCTSIFSTTPSTFPQSPAARNIRKHTTFVTTPTEERRSIRVVPASRRSSLMDRRTIDEKRSSYIRKRASAQSPFFSAGFRTSSSSYKSPPAFISEAQSPSRSALSPLSQNAIVRPNDDVADGKAKVIPESLRIVRPPTAVAETSKREFPGSLRKYRTNRPQTAITPPRNRVEKTYNRPGTTIASGMGEFRRRASTRNSLRAYDLKASLNDLTGEFYMFVAAQLRSLTDPW